MRTDEYVCPRADTKAAAFFVCRQSTLTTKYAVRMAAGRPGKPRDDMSGPGEMVRKAAEEMLQIAEFESRKRGFGICPEAKEKLLAMCGKAVGRPDLGNGRFCRNLVETAMMSYAERMYGESGGKTGEEFVLAAEDFHFPEELKDERVTMGFRV